jgi:lysophospholipase L1-like esterase
MAKRLLPFLVLMILGASLSSAEPIRVACIGDSLTAGAKVKPATESYPAVLQQLLGAGFTVKNLGIGGATMIRKGSPNIFKDLPAAAAFLPQIAIVNFGINDTRSRDVNFWSHFDEFPGDAKAALTELLDLPSQPYVILCLPTAIFADLPNQTQDRKDNVTERIPRLAEVRAKLREVAASFAGRRIEVVDLSPATAKHPEFADLDGIHLQAGGYRIIAETLRPFVEETAKKIAAGGK